MARPVAQFLLLGTLAVAIVGVATEAASRRVGQREAIVDARTTTLIKAQTAVEPAIRDGLMTQRPRAVAAIDRVVRSSVLDRSLVRVKIWRSDGTIVYSDVPALRGATYPLGAEESAALRRGVIQAEVSDLSRPENRYERRFGKLLEVYLPIRTPSGERVLFEAYYNYDAVSASGSRIWRSFAPVTIGSLVALELVQIPLAWSLARRLRDRQREREQLLRQALEASDNERRRIAGDLHDGVVQDLAGVAYALSGSSRAGGVSRPTAALLDRSAGRVREAIKALRTLLVDIYPPKLADAGLASALTDLVATAEARGVTATLEVGELPETLPDEVARLVWRTAQEGLRNVIAHAHASSVRLEVGVAGATVRMDIVDDGVGFDAERADRRAREGHVGLRSLADLAADMGGRLDATRVNGRGTRLRLEVPVS